MLTFRSLEIVGPNLGFLKKKRNSFLLHPCVSLSCFFIFSPAERLNHPSLSHCVYQPPNKHIRIFFVFFTEFAHFVPRCVILYLAHSTFSLFSPALLCHDPSVMLPRRAQTTTVQLIFFPSIYSREQLSHTVHTPT